MSWPFLDPVDPAEVPDYQLVVKDPMGEYSTCSIDTIMYNHVPAFQLLGICLVKSILTLCGGNLLRQSYSD